MYTTDLQTLAKKHAIRANQKSVDIVAALAALSPVVDEEVTFIKEKTKQRKKGLSVRNVNSARPSTRIPVVKATKKLATPKKLLGSSALDLERAKIRHRLVQQTAAVQVAEAATRVSLRKERARQVVERRKLAKTRVLNQLGTFFFKRKRSLSSVLTLYSQNVACLRNDTRCRTFKP